LYLLNPTGIFFDNNISRQGHRQNEAVFMGVGNPRGTASEQAVFIFEI
jgi:hypothetical protein